MPPTRYDITHTTEYDYSQSVAVSHHVARLLPRALPRQARVFHELTVDPPPAVTSTFEDYFGNGVTLFTVQGAHNRLVVRARSTVHVDPTSLPEPSQTPPWEAAADMSSLPFEAVEHV